MSSSQIRTSVLCLLAILLASCSSAPQRTQTTKVKTPVKAVEQAPSRSPDYYLSQARKAYSRTGDIRLRNQWVLKAAEAFKDQQQCYQSDKIIALVMPELPDDVQVTHAHLISAECLVAQTSIDYDQLASLLAGMPVHGAYKDRIERLYALLYTEQNAWIKAAKSTFLSNLPETEKSQNIWRLIQNLSPEQLSLARQQEPTLQPWLQLAMISHRFGLQPEVLSTEVQKWQAANPSHPLSQSLPEPILKAMFTAPYSATKIAVLLPLTGRLASQGSAIKDGILAAYMDAQRKKSMNGQLEETPQQIQFFDSALHSAEELRDFVSEFDFVIGPLLKDKITALSALLPEDKPILALNRIEQADAAETLAMTPEHQYYFALAPEDEAEQLVDKVIAAGAKHPILVAADAATTRRMAEAFINKWQTLHGHQTAPPNLSLFNSTKTLRSGVTELLDVAQSKGRIKQVENLVSKELHSVPRNRRDIDAIIVFATPEQTELLNPIIESSLSPFNDKSVPVFASSRSYRQDLNQNSLRDLRNLTFTDMPWMLPEHPWQGLEKQSTALWPQRKDTLKRLFALGYDGYSLVPHLIHLRTLPYLTINGLTGELSLTQDGQIVRKLPYGFVDNDEVRLIAMD